jgi:transposase
LRYGLHRNQLYGWRREFRSAAVADAGVPLPEFVPVVAERRVASTTSMIEIEIGSAIIRVRPDTDVAFLGAVVRLLKAPA